MLSCQVERLVRWSRKDSTWEPEEPLTQSSSSSESESEPSGSKVQSINSEEAQSQPPPEPEPAAQIPTGLPTPSPSPPASSSVNAANSAGDISASGSSTPLTISAKLKRPGQKCKTLPGAVPSTSNSSAINQFRDVQASTSKPSSPMFTSTPPSGIVRRPGPRSKTLHAATSTGGDMSLQATSTAVDSDEDMTGPEPVPAPASVSAPTQYSMISSAGTTGTPKVRPGSSSKTRKAFPSPAPPISFSESSADDRDRPGTGRGRAGRGKRPGPKPKQSRGRGRAKKAKYENSPPGKGKNISDVQAFSGVGHSLNSASPSVSSSSPLPPCHTSPSVLIRSWSRPPPLSNLRDEKWQAAAGAALSRYEKEKATVITDPEVLKERRHREFIKAQARKEIETKQEQTDTRNKNQGGQNDQIEALEDFNFRGGPAEMRNSKACAVDGVYFTCPWLGDQVLPLDEIENKILQFWCDRPKDEMDMAACALIHSCNNDKDKVAACVETLCMYLGNIIENPSETKFHKIRVNNKVFQTKVTGIVGVPQFLKAAGFSKTHHKGPSGEIEEVYEFHLDADAIAISMLPVLRDTLKSTQPILPELHRDVKVLLPAQLVETCELPPEFFSLTPREIKREQTRRNEIAKQKLTIRKKGTRDQDEIELTEHRLYRYALIRIRFPDGFTLQGTFGSNEKVGDLHAFVKKNLANPGIDFTLVKSGGEVLSNHEATLASYNLPLVSIVNFRVDSAGPSSQSSAGSGVTYLKPETLILVQRPSPGPEVSNSDGNENESSDEEWEVEEILDINIFDDETKEYYVKWKGYSSTENSWEPEKNLRNSQELITRFLTERYMTFKIIKK